MQAVRLIGRTESGRTRTTSFGRIRCGAWHTLALIAMVCFWATAGAPAAGTPVQPDEPRAVITRNMVTVKTVELPQPAMQNQLVLTLVEEDPAGGLWVLWHVGEDAVLQHFDNALKADRETITLKGHRVMGLYGHRDGSLAMTWRESHMTDIHGVNLFLKKVTAGGETIWNTKVRGDEGANLPYEERPIGLWHHPDYQGPAVRIAFNGKQYGLFYVVMQKFESKECHTGDEFMMVNADGSIDSRCYRHTWNASHSFWMSSAVGRNGDFFGVTYTDPFPFFGIRMGSYSQPAAKQSLIWPARAWPNTLPSTRMGQMFNMSGGFGMAISSGVPKDLSVLKQFDEEAVKRRIEAEQAEKSGYPILLRFDHTGNTARSTYLTTDLIPDIVVAGARFGKDSAIVAWGSGPGNMKGEVFGTLGTTMAVVDVKGKILQTDIKVNAPLTWNSDPITLSNGDVVWAGLADEWTSNDSKTTLYLVHVKSPASIGGGGAAQAGAKPVLKIDGLNLASLTAKTKPLYALVEKQNYVRALSLVERIENDPASTGEDRAQAALMQEHIESLAESTLKRIKADLAVGDVVRVVEELKDARRIFRGVGEMDDRLSAMSTALMRDKAQRAEINIGRLYDRLVARAEKAQRDQDFQALREFADEYPDSPYSAAALMAVKKLQGGGKDVRDLYFNSLKKD